MSNRVSETTVGLLSVVRNCVALLKFPVDTVSRLLQPAPRPIDGEIQSVNCTLGRRFGGGGNGGGGGQEKK